MDWIGASDDGSDAAANACNSIRREQGKRPKRRSTQLGDDEEEQLAAGRSVEHAKQKEDSRARFRLARDFTRPVIVMCGAGGWESRPEPRHPEETKAKGPSTERGRQARQKLTSMDLDSEAAPTCTARYSSYRLQSLPTLHTAPHLFTDHRLMAL
jgi:hypothetical protein